jgi:hypothetical protein
MEPSGIIIPVNAPNATPITKPNKAQTIVHLATSGNHGGVRRGGGPEGASDDDGDGSVGIWLMMASPRIY